jgi:hypothetical protein
MLFDIGGNRGPEAFYYYTVGVRIALSIGLNSEEEYKRQGLSEENKEVMRCTWWTVYLGDRLLSALRFEPPMIRDEDCHALLPSIPGQFYHPQDQIDTLQVSLMSSKEWYIPSPRNLSVSAYLLLLVKIHSRIIIFSQEAKDPRNKLSKSEYLYRECTIASSLRDWYAAIPDKVRNVVQEINGDKSIKDPKVTWKFAFIMTLYHCVRIYLPKRTLLGNIKENVTLAASSSAARDIFLAGCDVSAIIQGFMKHNPSFHYAPPFIASCIFGAGLMLLVVSRLNLNPNDIQIANMNVQTCIACLNQHATLYNIGSSQKLLLERLQTCQEPVLLVLAMNSLKNLKGDAVPSIANNMLQADDGTEDLDQTEEQQPLSLNALLSSPNIPYQGPRGFAEPALLESVAQMANPYADLMMGVQMNPDFGFDQMFNFSDLPK